MKLRVCVIVVFICCLCSLLFVCAMKTSVLWLPVLSVVVRAIDYETEGDRRCAVACFKALNTRLTAGGSSYQMYREAWMIPDLGAQCGTVKMGLRCFDGCRDSKNKRVLSPLMQNYRNVCQHKFKDFMDNKNCLSMHWPSIKWGCAEECNGESHRHTDALTQNVITLQRTPATAVALYDTLQLYCTQYMCNLFCAYPKVKEACGERAAVISASCDQKTLSGVQQIISYRRLIPKYPQECNNLAHCWIFNQISS